MNKYQKIIDYDKHEAHYFCNDNGISMEVSKDIIIDELQEEIERQEKSQVILDNQNSELQERIYKALDKIENVRIFGLKNGKAPISSFLNEVEYILKGENHDN